MNLIISLLLWPPTDHHPQCWSVSSNQCNQYSIRNHANPDQHSKSIAPILTSHSLYPAALSPGIRNINDAQEWTREIIIIISNPQSIIHPSLRPHLDPNPPSTNCVVVPLQNRSHEFPIKTFPASSALVASPRRIGQIRNQRLFPSFLLITGDPAGHWYSPKKERARGERLLSYQTSNLPKFFVYFHSRGGGTIKTMTRTGRQENMWNNFFYSPIHSARNGFAAHISTTKEKRKMFTSPSLQPTRHRQRFLTVRVGNNFLM